MTDVSPPRSIARILGLFETIARAPDGLPLADLSVLLDAPKSSVLILLRSLVTSNHLMHIKGRYQLGPAIFKLASEVMANRKFPNLMRGFLEELVAKTGETAILTTLDRNAKQVTYVESIDSPQPVRYMVQVGATQPLYCCAAGRLLLAYQDKIWRDDYCKTVKLQPVTAATLTNRKALSRLLEEIRAMGISVSIGEAIPGAACVAAPIYNADGNVTAAFLIGGPADRIEREIHSIKLFVASAAERASSVMGYLPPIMVL